MSRGVNCYDNAVVESFFSNLHKKCVKCKIHETVEEVKSEVIEFTELDHKRIIFNAERITA